MLARAMRSGFPNNGNRTMAVRIAVCAATDMIRARRRMRRSRARCSGLPSTKQPCKEPKSFCGLGPGSIDITHLHRKVLRVRTEIFATPASCGLLNYRRKPAPRSQGCEVRASSRMLDTGEMDKFPRGARCQFLRSIDAAGRTGGVNFGSTNTHALDGLRFQEREQSSRTPNRTPAVDRRI